MASQPMQMVPERRSLPSEAWGDEGRFGGRDTPGEALSYDTRFDDGSPVTGTIVAFAMSGDFCAQPWGDTLVYDLQTAPGVLECSLAHRTGL